MRYFVIEKGKVVDEVKFEDIDKLRNEGKRILSYDFDVHKESQPEFLIEQNGELHDSSYER